MWQLLKAKWSRLTMLKCSDCTCVRSFRQRFLTVALTTLGYELALVVMPLIFGRRGSTFVSISPSDCHILLGKKKKEGDDAGRPLHLLFLAHVFCACRRSVHLNLKKKKRKEKNLQPKCGLLTYYLGSVGLILPKK